ncbi:unnamed protein product [Rotaria sp. Silwood2]|nr:unnamed protein product [Rotaria sp. Silwood2]CAF4204958.1 unnamed protein product [Rotaria sp. Silwood2]
MNQTVFWTGQFVSGMIEFNNYDHQELRLKSINAELIGEFVRLKAISKGVRSETKIIVFKEELNLYSISDQDSSLLTYENHKWPFRFFLNNFIPPSIEKNRISDSYIHYFLRIKLIKPEWYKRNIQKTILITVKHASSPVNATRFMLEDKNRNNVYLRIILQKQIAIVGKNFSFEVDIQNPKQAMIRRISVTLTHYFEFGSYLCQKLKLIDKPLEKIRRLRSIHFHDNFQLYIPHTASPTFSFYPPSDNKNFPISVRYELRFVATIRGFFTNIRLQVPLIINSYPENN